MWEKALFVIITLVTYTEPSTLAVAIRMVHHKNVEEVSSSSLKILKKWKIFEFKAPFGTKLNWMTLVANGLSPHGHWLSMSSLFDWSGDVLW